MLGYRVVIVSDDREWADRAVRVSAGIGQVPEKLGWSEATTLSGPPPALVLDVDPGAQAILAILERWAKDVWYTVCITSLRPTHGTWATHQRLQALGYRHFVYGRTDDSFLDDLRLKVQRIIDDRCWLVPQAVHALRCQDATVVEALSVAVIIAPGATTLERWARELGLTSVRGLERLFRTCRVARPASVFQWLRLACVIEFAVHQSTRPSREELAGRFGYASGDYLGKRASALTGFPLGKLLTLGLDAYFESMSARVALES